MMERVRQRAPECQDKCRLPDFEFRMGNRAGGGQSFSVACDSLFIRVSHNRFGVVIGEGSVPLRPAVTTAGQVHPIGGQYLGRGLGVAGRTKPYSLRPKAFAAGSLRNFRMDCISNRMGHTPAEFRYIFLPWCAQTFRACVEISFFIRVFYRAGRFV